MMAAKADSDGWRGEGIRQRRSTTVHGLRAIRLTVDRPLLGNLMGLATAGGSDGLATAGRADGLATAEGSDGLAT